MSIGKVEFERQMPWTVGVDLGQSRDFTAISVIERVDRMVDYKSVERRYAVRHLERLPLGTSYPDQVAHIGRLIKSLPRAHGQGLPKLVVDQTGVGRPVVDLLTRAGMPPVGVVIHGGRAEGGGGREGHTVPKRTIVHGLVVLFQAGKLKIANALPLAEDFIKELLDFKVTISDRGHDTYDAAHASVHDDLVVSCALGVWLNERNNYHTGFTEFRRPEGGIASLRQL